MISAQCIIKGFVIMTNKKPEQLLRSFRIVCAPEHIVAVESLLEAEGYKFKPEQFSSWCRVLTHEPRPLGSSLAAFFGFIYIQDRSSMLPPLALLQNIEHEHGNITVLDMCASPGSKTGFLAQLAGKNGFVLGNEPSNARLATLRANMQQLGFLQVGTCNYSGEDLPLKHNTWKYIQLDPPCSGWGTVAKNPQVLDLWKGKKISPLIDIQRRLLQKAHELLCIGGCVVYSTCTTNIAENEDQITYATEELGFELVPLNEFDGFMWEHTSKIGTLRVDGKRSDAQGFYIAKLRKIHNTGTELITESNTIEFETLSPHVLDGPCTDINLLPSGHIMLFGHTVRFVPDCALQLLNTNLRWQAAALGKLVGQSVRLLPHITMLMPNTSSESALMLASIQEIHALLQGQSLKTSLSGREAGLYYASAHGLLPLGRISLKNGRAIWTAR